jgi:hypothetical protein
MHLNAMAVQVGLVGSRPLWKEYRNITRHESWVGPWLEDDSMLVGPQIWAGRMVSNIQSAYAMGVRGHLGTHWRTKPLSPNIHALLASSFNVTRTRTSIWVEWCTAEFGAAVATDACTAFLHLDNNDCDARMSRDLLKTSACPGYPYAEPSCLRPAAWDFTWLNRSAGKGRSLWSKGPEGSVSAIQANAKQCAYRALYHWVDPFCALLNASRGATAAELGRLQYWCHSFQYMRALAAVDCAWYTHRAATARLASTANESRATVARADALPARVAMLANLSTAITLLMSTVGTVGEIGMLSHILNGAAPMMLENHTEVQLLVESLGHALPAEALPRPSFAGESRIFVPSIRPVAVSGATLEIIAAVLSPQPPTSVWLQWRPLHNNDSQPVQPWSAEIHMAAVHAEETQVYSGAVVAPNDDFEWMVAAHTAGGVQILFPAAAPASGEHVVIWNHRGSATLESFHSLKTDDARHKKIAKMKTDDDAVVQPRLGFAQACEFNWLIFKWGDTGLDWAIALYKLLRWEDANSLCQLF